MWYFPLKSIQALAIVDDNNLPLRSRIRPDGVVVVLHHGGVGGGYDLDLDGALVGVVGGVVAAPGEVGIPVAGSLVGGVLLRGGNAEEGCGDDEGEGDVRGGLHGTTLKEPLGH